MVCCDFMDQFQFHPVVAEWFEKRFGTPTQPQELGWPSIQSGAHTLIAAPTGSGKTLAAFLASLDALFRDGLNGTLREEIRVLYVSPLKALSNDIHKNLEEPLAGIRAAFRHAVQRDIAVRAEVRTGDTSAARRQAMVPASAAHSCNHTGVALPAADLGLRAEDAGHGARADCG